MLKKYISYLGVLILACFSFYYTDKATSIIKRNDPIMKNILSESDNYLIEPVNAVVNNDEIIPGVNGIRVNLDKSYKNMKKNNIFDENMYVFEEIKPNISFIEEFDKYIVSGNSLNNNISLVFKVVDTSYLDKLYSIILEKNIDATLFIDGYVLENNTDKVIELIESGLEIENLGYDGAYNNDKFIWTNNVLASLTKKDPKFCYTDYKVSKIIEICSKNNMYTIKPSISINNYPFLSIKNELKNGLIIGFNLNYEVIKELPSIITFIKQKGYNLVTLDNLLNENYVEEK